MKNEPANVYLLCYDLTETDKDYLPTDNDFDTLDVENVLWSPNKVDGMENVKYIHHSEVDKLVHLVVDTALTTYRDSLLKSGLNNDFDILARFNEVVEQLKLKQQ